ncbi:MAG: hypothetical protein HYS41_01190 [Candidatus Omnitrophica bacterium]|nr:hypothetical protein [Candidatus Omnitrophota bacterium]
MRVASFLSVLVLAAALESSSAAADPAQRRLDPAERAGASLSRTLAALQAERDEVARRQAVEWARAQALFTYVVNAAPSADLGEGSLDWLAGQGDPLVTGIEPIAGRKGLLASFTIPSDDPLAFLKGRSWSYDNAVAAVAFTAQGEKSRAKAVLTALNRLVASGGTIGFSYQIDSAEKDSRVRAGTLAWVGYAFAHYQRVTKDKTFEGSAKKIAAYLKKLQLASGSLKGGPDVKWVSTEHNIDAYFFFRELYRVTSNKGYLTTANKIKASLLKNHWVAKKGGGHFLQGIGDSTPALDANSWGALFLQAIGKKSQALEAMKYVEATFKNQQAIPGSSTKITGYAPDSKRKTVWLEGTLGVAVAYLRLGKTSQANSILNGVSQLQSSWEDQGRWNGALPYAFPRYVNPDGDTLAVWESVASTGWLLIAKAVKGGNSRFWD